MSDVAFSKIIAEMTPKEGAVIVPVPENWAQGRTAYGGYTVGAMLGATRALHPGLPPLRSALVNFTGPVSAPPRITAEVLRAGRNVTTVLARAEVEGAVVATVTFSFGVNIEHDLTLDLPAPDAPAPEDCERFTPKEVERFVPRFFSQFDTRLIAGGRPYSGMKEGYIRAWSRHQDEGARETWTGLMSLGDVLPPAIFPLLNKMVKNSSMTWLCNFLTDDIASEGGWYQVETRMTAAQDGYSSQVMRIWNAEGRLISDGMQSVVVFG